MFHLTPINILLQKRITPPFRCVIGRKNPRKYGIFNKKTGAELNNCFFFCTFAC